MKSGKLTEEQARLVAAAREKARILYEGKLVPHRSCGICLAETFGLPWRSYEALRRGGLTGEGSCGAIRAGELALGEILGPERPEDPAPERLKDAIRFYQSTWKEKQAREGWGDTICNNLTAPLGDFMGAPRAAFCTSLAADAAERVAEALVRVGHPFAIEPIPGVDPSPHS